MNRFTLKDIKDEALLAANAISIDWDMLTNDPKYRSDFERILQQCSTLLPHYESLYVKLVGGEHVLEEGKDTSIDYASREMFLDRLEDELFATYQLVDMWNRYQLITDITSETSVT